jgi:hypothetical protein
MPIDFGKRIFKFRKTQTRLSLVLSLTGFQATLLLFITHVRVVFAARQESATILFFPTPVRLNLLLNIRWCATEALYLSNQSEVK